jgi:hypothetical protein
MVIYHPYDTTPTVIMALMSHIHHLPACFGAISAGFNTFIHTAYFLAIKRACFADLSTNSAQRMLKGTTQHKIGGSLAYLSTIHQQAEVIGFNMFPAGFKAMIHTRLQANLVTASTSSDTGLHGWFSICRPIHGILLIHSLLKLDY